MYILQDPLAFIIRPIYNWIGNYGITLVVVTILVRLLTIPLTIKSQKNVSKTQLIQPEITRLQEKYKSDRDTLAREMQKIYKKYDVNPLGGCLPLILQMLILFGFIGVIYNPIECILQLSKSGITDAMKEMKMNEEWIKAVNAVKGQDVNMCGLQGVSDAIRHLGKSPINFDLFGIDLSRIPSTAINSAKDIVQWIFPALAFIATVISSILTKKQTAATQAKNSKNNQQQNPGAGMGNMMIWMMPVMTLFFIFMMPIAMSLYWFVSTAFQVLQQTVINKFITKKIQAEIALKGNNR